MKVVLQTHNLSETMTQPLKVNRFMEHERTTLKLYESHNADAGFVTLCRLLHMCSKHDQGQTAREHAPSGAMEAVHRHTV
jgi:hypothetical protein